MSGIEVQGVRKAYRTVRGDEVVGLQSASFSVQSGEFVSLVGRSGCGKSTLLRLIAGLEEPSGGRIAVGAQPVSGPPDEVRYVFQAYGESLLPWKTVGDNIAFGLRHAFGGNALAAQRHEREAQVRQALADVGLHDVAHRFPSELSGGMQQRVAIARALAAKPRVLLLDEPFSAVDALSRAQLQDLLLEIWRTHGITILFVTHDIDEALYLSDRVLVLGPGGVGVVQDTPVRLPRPRDQVLTRASADYQRLRADALNEVLRPTPFQERTFA